MRSIASKYYKMNDGQNHTIKTDIDMIGDDAYDNTTEVPKIAQMFGLDTSVKLNMVSVSSTVSLGSRAVRAVTHR